MEDITITNEGINCMLSEWQLNNAKQKLEFLQTNFPKGTFRLTKRLKIQVMTGKTWVSACLHGHNRYRCQDCARNNQCNHLNKKNCGCRKTGICVHGRQKLHCRTCGYGFCSHGTLKYTCVECKKRFCIHKLKKTDCPECRQDVGVYCDHNVLKSTCEDCGAFLCEHKLELFKCSECFTFEYM